MPNSIGCLSVKIAARALGVGELNVARFQARSSARPSIGNAAKSTVEDGLGVMQLFAVWGDVQNEGLEAATNITGDFVGDLFIAAYQIRTERLIILKWPHPINALDLAHFLDHLGKLLVPDRVRDAHGHLMCELPSAVTRESLIRNAPGVRPIWPGDDPHADAGLLAVKRHTRLTV